MTFGGACHQAHFGAEKGETAACATGRSAVDLAELRQVFVFGLVCLCLN
jgi:hypothetical protein